VTAKQNGFRGKVRDGNVVSDKMEKTIVVAIESNFRHRLYKKTVRRVRRFMAHDELEEAKLGDRVRIAEASPYSRHKRWRLLEVLTRADLPEVAPESIDLELLGEVKTEEPEVEETAAVATEPVPEEAVSSPEAEAVVPEKVDTAEEVPEIEEAGPVEAEAEPEASADEAGDEPADESAEEAGDEPLDDEAEQPEGDETADEEKSS
jgi:small subunit ribosomal protein S17